MDRPQLVGQIPIITRRENQFLSPTHYLRQTADPRYDGWQAAGHGFGDDEAKLLGQIDRGQR